MVLSKQQRGVSTLGFLFFLIIFLLVGYLAVKLIPSYLEFNRIKTAMVEVTELPGIHKMRKERIASELSTRSGIESNLDFQEIISTASTADGRVLNLHYEVLTPLFANLNVLADFKHSETAAR